MLFFVLKMTRFSMPFLYLTSCLARSALWSLMWLLAKKNRLDAYCPETILWHWTLKDAVMPLYLE